MTPETLAGATVALATMHGKERAFGPVLAERLGIGLVVPDGLDTDRLGTFTGEVERPGSIEETALMKARLGQEATDLDLALASEGAYGPHPSVPILAAGMEIAVLADRRSGRVIRESVFDEMPRYAQLELGPDADLDAFLGRIGFPEAAVIVRSIEAPVIAAKGLATRGALDEAISKLRRRAPGRDLLVQTDMRAHMNPRRMETLTALAEKLARRLAAACPGCGAAGFGMTGTEPGLPCDWCGLPTALVRRELWSCGVCGHSEARPRADGRHAADPANCPGCNP